jgi:hypothetical protein
MQNCRNRRTKLEEQLRLNMKLQPAYDHLSQFSSKTISVEEYDLHIIAVLSTASSMKRCMVLTAPRCWNFQCYQKEQLAIKKLSQVILDGCIGPSVVLWGNGGFGPTSKGHPSAPNK